MSEFLSQLSIPLCWRLFDVEKGVFEVNVSMPLKRGRFRVNGEELVQGSRVAR
jgi:hypothetical protein